MHARRSLNLTFFSRPIRWIVMRLCSENTLTCKLVLKRFVTDVLLLARSVITKEALQMECKVIQRTCRQ